MSETPIFDSVRAEWRSVADAAFRQGGIAERQRLLKLLREIPRPGQQVKTFIEKLERTL